MTLRMSRMSTISHSFQTKQDDHVIHLELDSDPSVGQMRIDHIRKINDLKELLTGFRAFTKMNVNFNEDYILIAKKDDQTKLIVGELADIDSGRKSKNEALLNHKEGKFMEDLLETKILYVTEFEK